MREGLLAEGVDVFRFWAMDEAGAVIIEHENPGIGAATG